jgi:glyoxylase-like metal-dependent hydrolase (beta-lactamase superfamily II)
MFAQARAVLSAYEHVIEDPVPDTPIVPGVVPIEGFGHTPGHMMYHVFSGTENCYIIGDLLHEPIIQLKYPEISVSYDQDPEKAAGLRQSMLRFLAKEIMPIAGGHLPWPGVCRLIEASDGGYQALEL